MIDAAAYGKALFELAGEYGSEEQVREQLGMVAQVLEENPDYVTLVDSPAVATGEKLGLIQKAFGTMDPMLVNFLSILCEKREFYRFAACAAAYGENYDQAHNLLRATAITAVAMQSRQQEALQRKLAALTGKQVVLENRVDPSIIGGITLRYAGVQLDDSIQSRLDALRRSLNDTIV